MMSLLKSVLKKNFPKYALQYRAYSTLIANEDSFLYRSGWMKSLAEEKPMNKKGQAIPWMNYDIIKLLEERLSKEHSLFEYGSGYSTLFYADRVQSVISVEYDETWFNRIRAEVPSNTDIIFKNKDVDGEYCRAASSTKSSFDVIIVDGRDRVNCVKQSLGALSERGIIILDDSQRERYGDAFIFMKEHGYRSLNFEGMKPSWHGIDRTSIFYREGNCFGL